MYYASLKALTRKSSYRGYCCGEFVETQEPCHVGADLMAGSLIKNPGGGIVKTGGYIVGKKDLVEA